MYWLLKSQNEWTAVSSTKPQNEQVSSITEYLEMDEFTRFYEGF